MIKENASNVQTVTILGSLPPLRALSSYCLAFSLAISRLMKIEFISFKSIYPSFLYPGGNLKKDHTFPVVKESSNLKARRSLTWYNPLSWITEGILAKGQILHAQWWSPPLVIIYLTICLLYKARRKPVVITVHNIIHHEEKPFYDFCSRVLLKFGDHFIVHSKSNKVLLEKLYGIAGNKITHIPHGPLDFRCPDTLKPEDARDILGLRSQDSVILVFGSIRSYKGVDIALEAFARVVKELPDARLVIAGRPWELWDRYEKIIRERNISDCVKKHLHYIDTDDVAKYFLASDLVILPYLRFDSQSGVGTAAVAFRKPMIVTDTGGLPELVVDQKNVVPPGDTGALSRRIIYCLNNQPVLERMSQESETIAENISWDRIAKDTVSIYEKLLNAKICSG